MRTSWSWEGIGMVHSVHYISYQEHHRARAGVIGNYNYICVKFGQSGSKRTRCKTRTVAIKFKLPCEAAWSQCPVRGVARGSVGYGEKGGICVVACAEVERLWVGGVYAGELWPMGGSFYPNITQMSAVRGTLISVNVQNFSQTGQSRLSCSDLSILSTILDFPVKRIWTIPLRDPIHMYTSNLLKISRSATCPQNKIWKNAP